MTPLAWIGLILGIAGMICGIYALVRGDPQREQKIKEETLASIEAQALAAGIRDVHQGWIEWAADPLTYVEWAGAVTAADGTGYRAPSPMHHDDDQEVRAALEQQPRYSWGLADLRRYMGDLRRFQAEGGLYAFTRANQISSRLTEAAAIITDLRDDTYDPSRASTTGTWAFHKTASVRAAYLSGRGTGTEAIMEAITKARTDAREIDAAGKSIAAANERHAAALRALRETNRITESRDAHADFDRKLHD